MIVNGHLHAPVISFTEGKSPRQSFDSLSGHQSRPERVISVNFVFFATWLRFDGKIIILCTQYFIVVFGTRVLNITRISLYVPNMQPQKHTNSLG
jgi:flagellar biosynthesis protein FliP